MATPANYESTYFIVPTHIMNLPRITFAHVKVYETIFQFWNHGKQCFLSDKKITERTGLKLATIKKAYLFLEKHNELKRKWDKGKRYFINPQAKAKYVAVDKLNDHCPNSDTTATGVAVDSYSSSHSTATPVAHNINKLKKKKISNVFYSKFEHVDNFEKPNGITNAAIDKIIKSDTNTNEKKLTGENMKRSNVFVDRPIKLLKSVSNKSRIDQIRDQIFTSSSPLGPYDNTFEKQRLEEMGKRLQKAKELNHTINGEQKNERKG